MKIRGLSIRGLKKDLLERLKQAVRDNLPVLPSQNFSVRPMIDAFAFDGFPLEARWELETPGTYHRRKQHI